MAQSTKFMTVPLVFGTWPSTIFPSLFWPVTLIGNVAVSQWDIPAVAVTLAGIAALFAFLRFARTGQFMVAVADNADLAELYGIGKDRIHLATMLLAAVLVAVGMFLYGTRAQVQPTTAIDLMLFAIAATIIGGIGNLWGAAISAVVLGFVQNASVLFIPSEWQGWGATRWRLRSAPSRSALRWRALPGRSTPIISASSHRSSSTSCSLR